ncbi:putative nuclease HARBI1 [Phlebotomus papatasi]|uniref:putative nuclease HARBI1 n=1 Tax=Phlebotomus papatasi TaxID=29031 RepID=UPI002484380A|nr:putative nuclease HARBI1 [Phlebotomus papatasi]
MDFLLLVFLYLRLRRRHRGTNRRLEMRYLRDSLDPFDTDEFLFRRRYRMPQHLAIQLINEIKDYDTAGVYSWIPLHLKVLTTLNFLATGSYQRGIGDHFHIMVAQSTVSRCISYICQKITNHLRNKYICFPQNDSEKLQARRGFQEKFGIQNTLGAIDCTHVYIIAPPDSYRHLRTDYRNRKRAYSLNIEAVCNSDLIFTYINPRFPGSTHDSAIWAVTPLRNVMRNGYTHGENDWLIGDSGYPNEPWLMTPYPNTVEERHKMLYNRIHKRTRNVIERAFGVLKSVFRCVFKHRVLHYDPIRAAYIATTCFTLHNFLRINNIEFDYDDQEIDSDEDDEEYGVVRPHSDLLREGRRIRDEYALSLL